MERSNETQSSAFFFFTSACSAVRSKIDRTNQIFKSEFSVWNFQVIFLYTGLYTKKNKIFTYFHLETEYIYSVIYVTSLQPNIAELRPNDR